MGYVIALHEGSCSLVVGAQHSLIRRTFMLTSTCAIHRAATAKLPAIATQ